MISKKMVILVEGIMATETIIGWSVQTANKERMPTRLSLLLRIEKMIRNTIAAAKSEGTSNIPKMMSPELASL